MNFFARTCILLTLWQLVLTQKYLFQSAVVSFKRLKDTRVANLSLSRLTTIDQHQFAKAVDIKIRTKKMKMYTGAVKNLPNLKILRVKDCGIQVLEQNAFQNLPKIEEVHMQENDLTVIVNGVFNYLPIRELWLQQNEITTIQSGAFDNMPALEIIRLNRNMLSRWDSRWFVNTPKLRIVQFRRNKVTELPAKAFINIKTSHEVNGEEYVDTQIFLSSNNISFLHPEALDGIDSLHELCLRKNNLREVDWKVFSHMTELHKLNLDKNSLSKIESEAFENMSEMLELNLSRNLFECVPYDVVSKVKKVILRKNYDFKCSCLHNLRERLREEKRDSEIDAVECTQEPIDK